MIDGEGGLLQAARAWRDRILERFCLTGRRTWEREACGSIECESLPVTRLDAGVRGTVTCLADPGSPEARRLASLGLLPGTRIRLEQRRPVFVLRIGHGEVAMDEEMARCVLVRRDAD